MRLLFCLTALTLLAASSCSTSRKLQQLSDAVADAIPAPPPSNEFTVFGPHAYAPTSPAAAAAYPGSEVTFACRTPYCITPVSARAAAAAASATALQPAAIQSRRPGSYERCRTASPSLAKKLAADRRTESILQRQARDTANTARGVSASVPQVGTWFHVVSSNDTVEGGNVPDSWIAAQLEVLNTHFTARFSFSMLGTTRTINPDWVRLDEDPATETQTETQMKSALRRGTMATLNIYIVDLANYLGWAYFPSDLTSQDRILDGVIVDTFTLPGVPGVFPNKTYNLGATATHEVGHWLGLYHTFDSAGFPALACPYAPHKGGDFIADTPAEAEPARACVPRDSCPMLPGTDPIHNYMDYTDDECLTHFTPNQYTRMLRTWTAWRAGR